MLGNQTEQAPVKDAAATIFNDLNDADYSVEQKIEVLKELQTLLRSDIDIKLANLSALRSTF